MNSDIEAAVKRLFTDDHMSILDEICKPNSGIVYFDSSKDYYQLGRRSVFYDILRLKTKKPDMKQE